MQKVIEISLNTFIEQNRGNIETDMNGEKIMLNISNGKYYNLGEIGGAIWDSIKQPNSVNEVINKLLLNYDVTPKECKEQVESFIIQLINEELIIVKEG